MRTSLLVSALTASAFALPSHLSSTRRDDSWAVAPDSSVTCKTTDKIISFTVGPQLPTVLNNACAAMMPTCAYPDRAPEGTICTQTIDFKLDGPKASNQSVNVEDASNGNKLSGYYAQFSVTPATSNDTSSAGVFWTKDDCYGYFEYIVMQQEPVGCHNGMGSGIGSLKVGGAESLASTVFDIQIVKRQ